MSSLTCDLPSVSVLSWVVGEASVARTTAAASAGTGGVRLCSLFGLGGGVWRWESALPVSPVSLSLGAWRSEQVTDT